MKSKVFLRLVLVILLIVTLIFATAPYFYVLSKESTLHESPYANGNVYYYYFTGFVYYFNNTTEYSNYVSYIVNNQNNINGTYVPYSWGAYEEGVIILTLNQRAVTFNSAISLSSSPGFQPFSAISGKQVTTITDPFVLNFLNSYSSSSGSLLTIQGVFGVVKGSFTNSWGDYSAVYNGQNSTLRQYYGASFDTVPYLVEFPRFNSTIPSSWVPYPNFNAYDHVDGANILVQSNLGGNSEFLDELMVNNTLTHNGEKVVPFGVDNFEMRLVATNVALGPLDLAHYLTEYAFVIVIVWVLILPPAYFTVLRKKNLSRRQRIKK